VIILEILINNDKSFVEKMRDKQKKNGGYCTCTLKRTEDNKCMCKEFLQSEKSGWCHCHLYYKNIQE